VGSDQVKRRSGTGKGVWVSPDFDEPIDFGDYQ